MHELQVLAGVVVVLLVMIFVLVFGALCWVSMRVDAAREQIHGRD